MARGTGQKRMWYGGRPAARDRRQRTVTRGVDVRPVPARMLLAYANPWLGSESAAKVGAHAIAKSATTAWPSRDPPGRPAVARTRRSTTAPGWDRVYDTAEVVRQLERTRPIDEPAPELPRRAAGCYVLVPESREHAMSSEGGNGKARTFGAGLILGALVGAGLALLLAPQSGAETRRTLARRARQLGSDAKDRYEEARERIRRARAQRRQLRDEATGE